MRHLITIIPDRSSDAVAECKLGLSALPYLADHAFQDMIVLPGSFYLKLALLVHAELYSERSWIIRNVRFERPVILTTEDTTISIRLKEKGESMVEYSFFEKGIDTKASGHIDSFATIQVARDSLPIIENQEWSFSAKTFRDQAASIMTSESFYAKLRENGNQYGPRFQNISSIWRSDGQALAELRVPTPQSDERTQTLDPAVLDSVAHLLAVFILDRGKTFVLKSIDRIQFLESNVSGALWVHAALHSRAGEDAGGFLGDLIVFDSRGRRHLELSGVSFAYLDRIDTGKQEATVDVCIASNFTVEPMEDVLGFWADYFQTSLRARFAPYNQVFQQLLDPVSDMSTNHDGLNVILLGLEDWAKAPSPVTLKASPEQLKVGFRERETYMLPNGLEILHLNRYETDYVYKEIFEDECYLKHGIRLKDGDTVIDIGANIGLFSLFVLSQCRDAKIYAIEPSPVVYELLKANCHVYGSNIVTLNVGMSDRSKIATFTFYEKSSVFSGFYSNESDDREAIRAVVRNMLKGHAAIEESSLDQYADELMGGRMRRKSYECHLTSLSKVIRDHRIEKIDLLKVDAEKSELDILQGIEDSDWLKINQIVMEVHDTTPETMDRAISILTAKGFGCAIEEEKMLERSGLFNIYARRSETPNVLHSSLVESMDCGGCSRGIQSAAHAKLEGSRAVGKVVSLNRNTREFCVALRSFSSRTKAPIVLGLCPRTTKEELGPTLADAVKDAEQTLLSESANLSNVRTFNMEEVSRLYPVNELYDSQTHELAHIPYTSEAYAAIGTRLFRKLFALKTNAFKVIVLDCDNTLWRGVCGEDGPLGVKVDGHHQSLQRFMVAQMRAGMLLCLCSKNNEMDVWEVFERHTRMILQREHLAAWRINWQAKSGNIISLAHELNLGLDSFIFIDDNPVDCADVKANCPGVLTLQLPGVPESIPSFLDHIWAFDSRSDATEEDQLRTKRYQEESQREKFREENLSLGDFIRGLQLRVDIDEATEDQVKRVSQLTHRTNQFNFTTLRRSEIEISRYLKIESARCLVVHVADRFGDYGLVGVVMYESVGDRFRIDTLLLSCRVLGRGVEHMILAELGRRAEEERKTLVEFSYRPSEKNRPALEFITNIHDEYVEASGGRGLTVKLPSNGAKTSMSVEFARGGKSEGQNHVSPNTWTFPAKFLTHLRYNPDPGMQASKVAQGVNDSERPLPRHASFSQRNLSESMQSIGEQQGKVNRIVDAIEAHRLRKHPLPRSTLPLSEDSLERVLVGIWGKVLGRQHIGINDNFFEVGGTSLRAVQTIAAIKKELGRSISIVNLFESPTVKLLAAKLRGSADESQAESVRARAAERGQQRRAKIVRRKSR